MISLSTSIYIRRNAKIEASHLVSASGDSTIKHFYHTRNHVIKACTLISHVVKSAPRNGRMPAEQG